MGIECDAVGVFGGAEWMLNFRSELKISLHCVDCIYSPAEGWITSVGGLKDLIIFRS